MVNSTPVEVSVNECVDLRKVPLRALSHRSYELLTALLNKTKIFKSEDGYYRDWRGLFQVLKLEHYHKAELETLKNPTKRILDLWQESDPGANLKELQIFLGQIDRWDILDDSNKLLCEDAEKFLANEPNAVNVPDAVEKSNSLGSDEDIITKDDTRYKKQFYDAFILFADADIEFATKIMERMEERKLKLCVKDRDLLAGINFEHDAIIKLISERCRRLVVVISKEFLKSPLKNFLLMFAQALQIEQKKRKIIPCVYERLELPAHLKFYFILDYKRSNQLYDFWEKLEDAIKARTDCPVIENKNEKKETGVNNCPQAKVNAIEETSPEETDPPQAKKSPSIVVTDATSCKSDFQLTIKKSLSSCDISHAVNRDLTNKSKNSSSSTSELTLKVDSGDQELKKIKWYNKLGLSSSKSSLDGTGERSEKKKTKWYKSSKKNATAM